MSLCSVKTSSRSSRPARCRGNDLPQFLELRFGDVLLVVFGELDQPFEFGDLGLQLGHLPGHRQPLDQLVLELPAIGFGQVFHFLGDFAEFLLDLAEPLEVSEPLAAVAPATAGSPPCWTPAAAGGRSGPGRRCGSRPASARWKLCWT